MVKNELISKVCVCEGGGVVTDRICCTPRLVWQSMELMLVPRFLLPCVMHATACSRVSCMLLPAPVCTMHATACLQSVELMLVPRFQPVVLGLLYHISMDDKYKSMFTYTDAVHKMADMLLRVQVRGGGQGRHGAGQRGGH